MAYERYAVPETGQIFWGRLCELPLASADRGALQERRSGAAADPDRERRYRAHLPRRWPLGVTGLGMTRPVDQYVDQFVANAGYVLLRNQPHAW